MNTIAQQVVKFQIALEQAESVEDRIRIRSQYHEFVEQLSDDDKLIAYQAAKPFVAKLVQLIKEEGDPVLQRANELIAQIKSNNRTTTPTI